MEKTIKRPDGNPVAGKVIAVIKPAEQYSDAEREDGAETRRKAIASDMLRLNSVANKDGNPAYRLKIHKIPLKKGLLRRREPLILYPYLSPCQKYFTVYFDDIDMDLTEASIAKLKGAVESVLRMDWTEYAMGDPDEMTFEAQGLRNNLLALYRYESAQ